MTGEGYRALDDQLKQLKSVERPSVIAAISEAREHGDLSENAEYHAAKERQGWIEGQIAEIEDKISRAQDIDVSKLSGSQVKFGATVTVVDEDTEEEATYQIVGEHEADVKKGKISIASPIARAMISKEVGDVVEVNTPGGVKAYESLKGEWKYQRWGVQRLLAPSLPILWPSGSSPTAAPASRIRRWVSPRPFSA